MAATGLFAAGGTGEFFFAGPPAIIARWWRTAGNLPRRRCPSGGARAGPTAQANRVCPEPEQLARGAVAATAITITEADRKGGGAR